MHPSSKNSLEVKIRLDRHALMSMYEQSAWKFGVPVHKFVFKGDAALPYDGHRPVDVDAKHPAFGRAAAFAIELAKLYMTDVSARDQQH